LALGRAFGSLPARIVLYGVQVGDIPVLPGGPLRAEVEGSIGHAVEALAAEIRRYLVCGSR
jgi:hypothetical protein